MTISEAQKVRARHHMGYGGVTQASTFVLGVPAGVQTAFMIEGAWARILPSHESFFETILTRLDEIDQQIEDDTANVAADAIDEIKLRKDEFQQLIIRYKHWQGALANMLQVPPNPFDMRPFIGAGYGNASGPGLYIPVIH